MHATPTHAAQPPFAAPALPAPAESAVPARLPRLRADARPAWCEGRGPDPAPQFLIRWHPSGDTPRHDPAATAAEARALARDARETTSAEAAVYRLWSVLPD